MTAVITSLSKDDKAKLCRLLDIVVDVLTKEWRGERGGGSFNIRNEKAWILFDERSGEADENSFVRTDFFAGEKTFRLCQNPTHRLSFESHNMELQQYPGGVRFGNGLVGALSGYKWQEDEAATLWIGISMGWITLKKAAELTHISSNTYCGKLFYMFTEEAVASSI